MADAEVSDVDVVSVPDSLPSEMLWDDFRIVTGQCQLWYAVADLGACASCFLVHFDLSHGLVIALRLLCALRCIAS